MLLITSSGQVKISGTSNLHPYEIISNKIFCFLSIKNSTQNSILNLLSDTLTKINCKVFIPISTLSSGNLLMDEKLRKTLDISSNKHIMFKLEKVFTVKQVAINSIVLKVIGSISINNVTKFIRIVVNTKKMKNTIELKIQKSLNMTRFDIKPPTAMMGMLKTLPRVSLQLKLVLKVRNS